MSDPRSHYATVLDRELHFMEWGERGRPPLVMWHGLARSCRDFDDIARAHRPIGISLCPIPSAAA
jgi:hypothetical protein